MLQKNHKKLNDVWNILIQFVTVLFKTFIMVIFENKLKTETYFLILYLKYKEN